MRHYFLRPDRPDWREVELFFKELKQTLQLADFVGYNENAVRWQVWTGMFMHLLLRFMRHAAGWDLSFSRLAGVAFAAVWVKRGLVALSNSTFGRKGWFD